MHRTAPRAPMLLLLLLVLSMLSDAAQAQGGAPGPVGNAAAAPIVTPTSAGIRLTWTDPTSGTWTGTKVYRASTSGGTYTLLSDVAAGTRSYNDLATSLVAGTTYYYSIRAHNAGAEATGNPEVNAVAPSPFGTNLAPSAILAVSGVDTSLPPDQCTWNPGPKFNCAVDGSLSTYDIVHNGDGLVDNTCARSSNPNNYFEIDWGSDKLVKRIKASIMARHNGGCANLTLVANSGTLKEITAWSLTKDVTNHYEIVLPEASEARKLRFHWSASGGGWFQQRFYDIHINQLSDPTAPSPVTNLQASVGPTYVNLTWDAPPETDLMDYAVYRDAALLGTTTNRFWNDATVTVGTTYLYRVAARDTSYNYATNASVSAQPQDVVPPSAPTGLTATTTLGVRAVELAWTKPPEADLAQQRVYRDGVLLASIGTNQTYRDEAVVDLTTYSYYVVGVDTSLNAGSSSNTASATVPDATGPGQPANLQATPDDGSLALTWEAPGDPDVASYRVHLDGVHVDTTPAGTTSATLTGLVNGQTYVLRVSAVDTAGNEGAQSSPLSAIPRDATPPGQLVGLRVTYEGHQRVDLAWDANAEADLAGYIILADGAEVARTGSLTRSVTGLVNGQTYTLAVRAYDTSQNEGPPASVQARPRDDLPPAAPTGFTLEAHDRRVILRWTPPADADLAGVRVYRDGAHVRNVPVGTNEWTDTSVLNLVAYTYQLKAYDYAGNTGTGPTGSATPVDDAAPAQPVWDYTHGWDGKVELRWRPLADVVTYRILRDGIAIAQGLDANAYYDTTVVNGVTYAYRVQAIDAAGNAGPPSEPVTLGGIAPLSYDENVRELREGPVRMYAENLPWIAAVALIGIILCCIVGTAAFRK